MDHFTISLTAHEVSSAPPPPCVRPHQRRGSHRRNIWTTTRRGRRSAGLRTAFPGDSRGRNRQKNLDGLGLKKRWCHGDLKRWFRTCHSPWIGDFCGVELKFDGHFVWGENDDSHGDTLMKAVRRQKHQNNPKHFVVDSPTCFPISTQLWPILKLSNHIKCSVQFAVVVNYCDSMWSHNHQSVVANTFLDTQFFNP